MGFAFSSSAAVGTTGPPREDPISAPNTVVDAAQPNPPMQRPRRSVVLVSDGSGIARGREREAVKHAVVHC